MGPLVDIAIKLAMRCLTQAVVGKVVINGAWEIARRTKPTSDDNIVKAVAEAWGVDTKELAPVSKEPVEIGPAQSKN